MNVYVSVRRLDYPDRPQPVYAGAVSLWEAYRYPPIADSTRNGWRVGERVQDHTFILQTGPDPGWVQSVVDGVVQTWGPAFSAELRSARAGDGVRLDPRRVDPPIFGWVQPAVDAVVQTWAPSFSAELQSTRARDGGRLDPRGYDWSPQPAWIATALPAVLSTAQLWPALLAAAGLSYRSAERASLDVRRVDAPIFGWPQPVTDAIVASWLPNWTDTRTGERSPDGWRLDVRGHQAPAFAWVERVVEPIVASWMPALQAAQRGERTPEGRRLEPRPVEGPRVVRRPRRSTLTTLGIG